jgi:hypothetical protein
MAMIKTKGSNMNTLLTTCLNISFENISIAIINKKYNPKSLRREMGVTIMQIIMARKEIIFVLGSKFSICPALDFILQLSSLL